MNNIKQLKEYDKLYYNTGESPLTDEQYDKFKEEVEKEFPNNPYFKKVGASVKRDKVKLPYILGSLKKEKIDTIEKWMLENKGPYVYSEKIDGVSILVKYSGGKVIEAYTRGNGEYGQDITNKAKIFCPLIRNNSDIVVRGDVILFDKLNFKNRRNGAAGILNRDDTKQCKFLNPIFYECIEFNGLKIASEYEELVLLESINLEVPKWKMTELFDLQGLIEFYKYSKESLYDVDGVVVSINKNARENILYPKNKVAFKLQSEGVKTEVTNIEWNISRGGKLIPTIVVKPIEIDGSTINRTTGFNAQYIEQENIGIGTTLELVKSGDVIPYIISIDINGTICPELPEFCPSCNAFLKRKGVDLICDNPDCNDMIYKVLEHYIRTMGAENITEKTIRKLGVKTIEGLYLLTEKDIVKYEGFGEKKAEQVISEINRTLNNTHSNLLAAFGIPGVGMIIAKTLIKHFGSVDEVLSSNIDDLQECEGVGPIIANNIWEHSILCNEIYNNLKSFGLNLRSDNKGSLTDKIITLTGKGPLGRKELEALIIKNGGIMKGISKTTDLLVTDDVNSTSTKMEKARKLGIPIISYEEFMGTL